MKAFYWIILATAAVAVFAVVFVLFGWAAALIYAAVIIAGEMIINSSEYNSNKALKEIANDLNKACDKTQARIKHLAADDYNDSIDL